MAVEPNIEALFARHLGQEAATNILAKMDGLAKRKATPAQIEKAVMADISAHIEREVVSTVVAKIGPITPIKVKPISASVKSKIGPITVAPKINSGIQVKVGPPTQVKIGPSVSVKVGPGIAPRAGK